MDEINSLRFIYSLSISCTLIKSPSSSENSLNHSQNQIYSLSYLLVVLRIYVALAIFQPYNDMEVGDNQSLKSYRT